MAKRSQKIDHRLVAATSLQEASTWLRQAEIALSSEAARVNSEELRLQAEKDIEALQKIQTVLPRIHNRYSRIKQT